VAASRSVSFLAASGIDPLFGGNRVERLLVMGFASRLRPEPRAGEFGCVRKRESTWVPAPIRACVRTHFNFSCSRGDFVLFPLLLSSLESL
jgi:hypothetical protein